MRSCCSAFLKSPKCRLWLFLTIFSPSSEMIRLVSRSFNALTPACAATASRLALENKLIPLRLFFSPAN
jgi:hypothetical protein